MNHRSRTLLFVTLTAFGCGGAGGASGGATHPFPEARLAGADAKRQRGTQCAYSASFDAERGCALDSWGIPLRVRSEGGMGPSFVLVGAAFALDGVLVFDSNDPELLAKKSFPVLTTGLRSGPHELSARLTYRGEGHGVFSYLRGYRFRVEAAHQLDARASEGLSVVVQAYERGGATTPIEKRPALRFEVAPQRPGG